MKQKTIVKKRCAWAEEVGDLYVEYHDNEWGVPVHNDRKHFEFLILEGAQAGLSWSTVLKKREGYRKAFAGFDPVRVARFSEKKIEALLQNSEIIRNRLKVCAAVSNARAFLSVQKEFGSFNAYIWGFVGGKPVLNKHKIIKDIPATSPESDTLSKDLKKRGFKFVGSIIIYAHMQAVGMVNDHVVSCFRYMELKENEKYRFREKLIEGVIKSRPNRFIMVVDINGKNQKCYCPSTGKIGNIEFEDIPCLLSKSDNTKRKMPYTVEAFSLHPISKKKKSWIGINQVQVNRYVEHFFKTGQLIKMVGKVEALETEVKLGTSRLDFLVNEKDYVEVKTLLRMIPTEGHPNHRKIPIVFAGYDRLMKHFGDIVRKTGKGSRAIVVFCHTYDAKRFTVPKVKGVEEIANVAKKAQKKGMEIWQINLKVDPEGVILLDYFKLNLPL